MELHFSEISTPPTPAATVILLRTGQAGGLQVLLQKRHNTMDVLAGAYVFPGGKVDADDHLPSLQARLGCTSEQLQVALGQSDIDAPFASAFYVAALRELAEESTIWLDTTHNADVQKVAQVILQLQQGQPFSAALAGVDLPLPAHALHPWSRWITPRKASVTTKRFDTLFFVAALPEGQTACHDHQETTDTLWLTPKDALRHYWEAQVSLAPPQIMTLVHLARFESPQAVIAHASNRPPFVVEPEPNDHTGTRWLCYPGDPEHSQPLQYMPGPTRLAWRNKRFEPADGFDAFFV